MKKKTLLATLVTIGMMVGTSQAANYRFVGSTGDSWHDLANWEVVVTVSGVIDENETTAATSFPTTSDNVGLFGRTVHITEAAAASGWRIWNVTASGTGSVVVDDGGVLTTSAEPRYLSTFTANDGGTINFPGFARYRSDVTINAGGTASGGHAADDNKTLLIDGTWSPRGTTKPANPNSNIFTVSTGKVILGSTGTIVLDVYDNDYNENFVVSGTSTSGNLTINTGTIELRLQDSYVPEIGHAFTLWSGSNPNGTLNIGNGSNIVMPGLDAGLFLDVSQFETSGIVTVALIPEPASMALLGLGGLIMISGRRRLA